VPATHDHAGEHSPTVTECVHPSADISVGQDSLHPPARSYNKLQTNHVSDIGFRGAWQDR
jgi:hypothetical protein